MPIFLKIHNTGFLRKDQSILTDFIKCIVFLETGDNEILDALKSITTHNHSNSEF